MRLRRSRAANEATGVCEVDEGDGRTDCSSHRKVLSHAQALGWSLCGKSRPQLFIWTANPDEIIAAVRRAYQVLDTQH